MEHSPAVLVSWIVVDAIATPLLLWVLLRQARSGNLAAAWRWTLALWMCWACANIIATPCITGFGVHPTLGLAIALSKLGTSVAYSMSLVALSPRTPLAVSLTTAAVLLTPVVPLSGSRWAAGPPQERPPGIVHRSKPSVEREDSLIVTCGHKMLHEVCGGRGPVPKGECHWDGSTGPL